MTIGTGGKVVESAGVVRVKVSYKMISHRFKYILADGQAHCVLLDNRYTRVDSFLKH